MKPLRRRTPAELRRRIESAPNKRAVNRELHRERVLEKCAILRWKPRKGKGKC
jgi:hypothetical protein